MIYSVFRAAATRLLRLPRLPPDAPPGDPLSADSFRASRRYLGKQLTLNLTGAVGLLVVELIAWVSAPSSTWLTRQLTTIVLGITGLSVVSTYLLTRLEYDLRYYILSDRCLRIRRGIWIVEESTYTLANVQTVAIKQNPLDRAFGVCSLHIETAGGGASDSTQQRGESGFHRGIIQGVEVGHSEQLQKRLLRNVSQFVDSGLGEAHKSGDTNPAEPAPFFSSPTPHALTLLKAISTELQQLNATTAATHSKPPTLPIK